MYNFSDVFKNTLFTKVTEFYCVAYGKVYTMKLINGKLCTKDELCNEWTVTTICALWIYGRYYLNMPSQVAENGFTIEELLNQETIIDNVELVSASNTNKKYKLCNGNLQYFNELSNKWQNRTIDKTIINMIFVKRKGDL